MITARPETNDEDVPGLLDAYAKARGKERAYRSQDEQPAEAEVPAARPEITDESAEADAEYEAAEAEARAAVRACAALEKELADAEFDYRAFHPEVTHT